MIKIRNTSFLAIIYGYDYNNPIKLKALVDSKITRHKIRKSIDDMEKGLKLLRIKQSEINEENVEYINLCKKILQNRIKLFDPRL